MTLHRPFIARHHSSRSAAIEAACEALDLQNSIVELTPHPQSRLYGTIFSTIEASIFLCGVMIELPPQSAIQDRRIRQAILQAIGRLTIAKDRSPLAKSGGQLLRQYYRKVEVIRPPILEQTNWVQPEAWQTTTLWQEDGQPSDILIPPFQQPFHETFQSLLSSEQICEGLYDPTLAPTLAFGDPFFGDVGDFANQAQFVWPDYSNSL
jgi:hypothetical protein